jgi:glycosyltransferase involved in cell wall biosynthesis
MKVTQISSGRFHHFHLARQMERLGLLKEIWTGYPRFKLKDEAGIPPSKIRTFPWLQGAYMKWSSVPFIGRSTAMHRELGYWILETLDRRVSLSINEPTALIALSGQGKHSGRKVKALGGVYICDRGSSHIRYQDMVLREESRRWGTEWIGVHPSVLAKEEEEYHEADIISVPSQFCMRSFAEMGVPADKMRLVPYGGRLDRFKPVGNPDQNEFVALFVGQVSLRKGIPYLLSGFSKFRHPNKKLKIIGHVPPAMEAIVRALPLEHVEFLGQVPNTQLSSYYSTADCLVLPSLEEGLSMVMAEAMACGCPVIASTNTGAEDLFDAPLEGRVIGIRDDDAIADALQDIADSKGSFRPIVQERIRKIGGWDDYGNRWKEIVG